MQREGGGGRREHPMVGICSVLSARAEATDAAVAVLGEGP
jgi:hypothetical protein